MRAAIYARYSTDLQSDASIEDQIRLCQRLADQNGLITVQTYSDAAPSGASQLRPGYQQLLQDARTSQFDIVLAEGLDRFSPDQEHIAAFYKQMVFHGMSVVSVSEGLVSELHIGLKGTISSLFLSDLAQKTRRGLEGRVRSGKSAGGITYGYDVVRSLEEDGNTTRGERRINLGQAEVVRRIFRDYAKGVSPRSIASALNEEGIPGPRGTWGASTIHGNQKRRTGLLNNELYVGKLIWNRQRFVKDPMIGKCQARLNPPERWVIEDVPEIRILDDDLWASVKTRQSETRKVAISDGFNRTKRAKHFFPSF
ncbi:recombinase family protein [Roseivivax sp. GX 12232]|uniref:recombinase family protein n=1 Tax=Roseivivax sp. GX 12232 TaxID=2900547 RepID=UPI001E58A906|nr:recombinase family protein [Roseivivax sp. GX 12232]MCE0505386.1 recombinase family protein [Roseivivax sp. GX 12232]